MRGWGVTTLRILDALEQYGPMTRAEMSKHLNLPRQDCSAIFSRLSRPSKRPEGPKRIYITGWRYDEEGQRRYPRAVYAIGDLVDAAKPKSDIKANRRRYRQSVKGRRFVSILLIGATQKAQAESLRKLRRAA